MLFGREQEGGRISQWMKRGREEGPEGLRRRIAPGAIPRLSAEQRDSLPELLAQGAPAHGFRGDVWTCRRVAEVIRREFLGSATTRRTSEPLAQEIKVEFAKARASGEPAGRRSDRTLERGALARAQKGAIEEGKTIMFVDQSGFSTCCLRWYELTLR